MRRMPAVLAAVAAIILSTGHAHAQQRRKPATPPVPKVPSGAAQAIQQEQQRQAKDAIGAAAAADAQVRHYIGPEPVGLAELFFDSKYKGVFKNPYATKEETAAAILHANTPAAVWCWLIPSSYGGYGGYEQGYVSYGAKLGYGWIADTLEFAGKESGVTVDTVSKLGKDAIENAGKKLSGKDFILFKSCDPGGYSTTREAALKGGNAGCETVQGQYWKRIVLNRHFLRLEAGGVTDSGVKVTDQNGSQHTYSREFFRDYLVGYAFDYAQYQEVGTRHVYLPEKREQFIIVHVPNSTPPVPTLLPAGE